jgi:tRNA modification GTPase
MGTTIAAIASPPGPGLRGVLRLSGPEARELLRALARRPLELSARSAFATRIFDGTGEQPALVLWMPGPASYTREDVGELHLPGAPALLAAAFARLIALGARAAAPGEFTRRAFLNGRLDLSQAEGVLELVEAAGERERRAALVLLEGGLAARLAALRQGFVDLRALVEASLDFDALDTGHVPEAELDAQAGALALELEQALAFEVRRQSPRALPRVVLAGRPNAGKSTLFNALVPGAEALVSPVAGSTRDGVHGLWTLALGTCLLCDAPGLAPPAGEADRLAQEFAARERESADLILELVDASASDTAEEAPAEGRPRRLCLWSRIDRPGARPAPAGAYPVSAVTGAGLLDLAQAVGAVLFGSASGAALAEEGGFLRELSARHRGALLDAARELAESRRWIAQGEPLDLVAEGLWRATDALDRVSGRTLPEDLLDRIFARFCLGK